MERAKLPLSAGALTWSHENATLIIHYKKPAAVLQARPPRARARVVRVSRAGPRDCAVRVVVICKAVRSRHVPLFPRRVTRGPATCHSSRRRRRRRGSMRRTTRHRGRGGRRATSTASRSELQLPPRRMSDLSQTYMLLAPGLGRARTALSRRWGPLPLAERQPTATREAAKALRQCSIQRVTARPNAAPAASTHDSARAPTVK